MPLRGLETRLRVSLRADQWLMLVASASTGSEAVMLVSQAVGKLSEKRVSECQVWKWMHVVGEEE
jgi:hypothetical protein